MEKNLTKYVDTGVQNTAAANQRNKFRFGHEINFSHEGSPQLHWASVVQDWSGSRWNPSYTDWKNLSVHFFQDSNWLNIPHKISNISNPLNIYIPKYKIFIGVAYMRFVMTVTTGNRWIFSRFFRKQRTNLCTSWVVCAFYVTSCTIGVNLGT